MTNDKPKWIVRGEKNETQVNMPFADPDNMVMACMRLRALGFKVKTLHLDWRKVNGNVR
jgi:hypothetical protein